MHKILVHSLFRLFSNLTFNISRHNFHENEITLASHLLMLNITVSNQMANDKIQLQLM